MNAKSKKLACGAVRRAAEVIHSVEHTVDGIANDPRAMSLAAFCFVIAFCTSVEAGLATAALLEIQTEITGAFPLACTVVALGAALIWLSGRDIGQVAGGLVFFGIIAGVVMKIPAWFGGGASGGLIP